jgi:hypothetical protein
MKQIDRFQNLFLHWSPYVRISFYRFLFYSLLYLHTKKENLESNPAMEALEQSYQAITQEGHFHPDDKDMVVGRAD